MGRAGYRKFDAGGSDLRLKNIRTLETRVGGNYTGALELTGKQMQEGNALKVIYDSDLERRVCFYKNSDGTFGFLEWRFLHEEDSWAPTRVGQGSRLSTIEDAVREATGRVGWLAAALGPH
jgi:hypothetical protein